MADLLPLFPLNTVLFPGLPLPLHVFEERYRLLLRELLAGPEPRRFGVVAIRRGLEAGDEDPVLHHVGCVAVLRRVHPYADGRYDLVVYGGPRFELRETDSSLPYLTGTVVYLPDPPGEEDDAAAAAVLRAFPVYRDAVADATDRDLPDIDLPEDDPALLSWIVAGSLHVDLPEKQELLEVSGAGARLRRELSLLRRETALLQHAARAQAPMADEGPFSLN